MRATIPNQRSETASKKITVLLADDHMVIREGLRALLATVSSRTLPAEKSHAYLPVDSTPFP